MLSTHGKQRDVCFHLAGVLKGAGADVRCVIPTWFHFYGLVQSSVFACYLKA